MGGHGVSRSTFDIFDYRDAIANSMVVASANPNGQPLTANEVVCLAGCDRGPGTVVYRKLAAPTLASISAPSPAPSLTPSLSREPNTNRIDAVSCIAGCYEPPKVRTVASLRNDATTRNAPVRVAARQRPIVTDVPITTAAPETARAPSPENVPSATAEPTVRLRSAFAPNGSTPAARTLGSKVRSRGVAKAKARWFQPQYGKRVPVPSATPTTIAATPKAPEAISEPKLAPGTPARAEVLAPTASTEVKASKPDTPVTTFAPQPRRPERRRSDQAAPHAAVSNDWFNQINRERREKEAAGRPAGGAR